MLRPFTRRAALGGLAGSCVARPSWSAPAAMPEAVSLVVAGPAGGRADRWADLLSPALGKALQQSGALSRQNVGGADGVTGANQFEAHAAPDGSTALLVPGSAALSWLSGGARVKFDATRWVPVWSGTTSAALASRIALTPGRPIRLAVASFVDPVLAALLALDLMGVEVIPVPVPSTSGANGAGPDVDAVFLYGAALRAEAAALAASGMPLVLGFAAVNPMGESVRDPTLPDLPTAQQLIARTRPDASPVLASALRAVTAAVQLDMALVLPQLSPAAIVAWWRRGCGAIAQSPDIQAEAARTGTRPANPGLATANTAAIAVDAPVLLELRRWLSERYKWRPA